MDVSSRVWRKSSRSGNNGCVEVALDADEIAVRDSKDRDGPVLRFTAQEWGAFLAGVRDGEFEPPNAAPTTPRRRRGFRPWQAR